MFSLDGGGVDMSDAYGVGGSTQLARCNSDLELDDRVSTLEEPTLLLASYQ